MRTSNFFIFSPSKGQKKRGFSWQKLKAQRGVAPIGSSNPNLRTGSRRGPKNANRTLPTLARSSPSAKRDSVQRQTWASHNNKFSLVIHIKATFNNTLLTLTNFKGQVITWASAGSCGFKGARKGTPFAAKKVVEIFIKKSNDYFFRCDQIKIYVCGIGPGRENAIRGLASISKTIQQDKRKNKAIERQGFFRGGGSKTTNKIVLIREMTKIPHNGCRPTKKRRI